MKVAQCTAVEVLKHTYLKKHAAAKLNHVMALCLNCQNVFSAVVNVMV